MTRTEQIMLAVIVGGVLAAFLLPVEAVEVGITLQLVVLGVVAFIAGSYVIWANRSLERADSEYLWLLVRRDIRVMVGLLILGGEALLVLIPRLLGLEPWLERPWAVVGIVVAIDLFAVGLIDDAITMRRDRAAVKEARLDEFGRRLDAQDVRADKSEAASAAEIRRTDVHQDVQDERIDGVEHR